MSEVSPERRESQERWLFTIGVAAEGRKDKVAAGKPNGVEEGICRGGDDCAFFLRFPPNIHEVLIAGAVVDGVSEGGLGHEAAFSVAKGIRERLFSLFLSPAGGRYTRDDVAQRVLDEMRMINQIIRNERLMNLKRIRQAKAPQDEDTYAATAAIFLLQTGYDPQTGEPRLYLHSWSIGDSFVGIALRIPGKRRIFSSYKILRINIPHNVAGALALRELGISNMPFENLPGLTIEEQTRVVESYEKTYGSCGRIYAAFGFEDDLLPERIDYRRVVLPSETEAQARGWRIVAMTDGIWGRVKPREIARILKKHEGNDAAMRLVALGHEQNYDDCCAVVASLRKS